MKHILIFLTVALLYDDIAGQVTDEMTDTDVTDTESLTGVTDGAQSVWDAARQAAKRGIEAANQAASQGMQNAFSAMENAGNRFANTLGGIGRRK